MGDRLVDRVGLVVGGRFPDCRRDSGGHWNGLAMQAIRFANIPPPAAARQSAILPVARFDAVNGLGEM